MFKEGEKCCGAKYPRHLTGDQPRMNDGIVERDDLLLNKLQNFDQGSMLLF